MTKSPRIAVLDAGRTLAVLGVIAVHLAPWMTTSPVWLDSLANLGQYGVQCFFVISAITVAASLEHDARTFADTREVLRHFYVKRIARIAPLYYLSIVAYSVIDYFLRLMHGHLQLPHDFSDVVINALFLHEWVPSATDSVVPGGWSIGVEMCFYAFAPALVFLCRTRRGLVLVSAGTALFSASCWYLIACGGLACRIVNNEFFYFWPPTQLPCFIAGFWAWHLGRQYLTGEKSLPWSTCLAMGTAGVLMVGATYFCGTGEGHAHVLAPTCASLAAALLLLAFSRTSQRVLHARSVVVIGQNSYGIYVWHFVAILAVRMVVRIDAVDDFAEYHAVLVYALSMAAAVTLAYVGARFTGPRIEEPCTRWAKDWLARGPVVEARVR